MRAFNVDEFEVMDEGREHVFLVCMFVCLCVCVIV